MSEAPAYTVVGSGLLEPSPKGTVVFPHKFKNIGPGSLDIICIHPSPRFIQEDLELDS